MKRKEFLQRSAVVAAVTLAAAVMEPGTVRAADTSAQEISAQVLAQSVDDQTPAADLPEDSTEQVSASAEDVSSVSESSDTKLSSDTENSISTSDEVKDDSSDPAAENAAEESNVNAASDNSDDSVSVQSAGWITNDDGTTGYRAEDGTLCQDEIREINGKLYYFDDNGALVKNDRFYYDGSYYRSSEDGSLYQNSWSSANTYGDIYYYGSNGAAYDYGYYEIDRIPYYFNGSLITNSAVFDSNTETNYVVDGVRYTFSQGKVIASSAKASWQKDSKGWWYRHADGSYAKNG